ncbi:MAG: metal-dependent hydrolase, partial [Pseudomonadota bacterium]
VSFKWLYILSFVGCLSHSALDWLNVYGIRLLEPFSSRWFYGDTLFIIDVWLWALLGLATWFSLRREKRGGEWKLPAQIAMAVAVAYIGMNGVISDRALATGGGMMFVQHDKAIASPKPIWFWEREVLAPAYNYDYSWYVAYTPQTVTHPGKALSNKVCDFDAAIDEAESSPQIKAFLFWSRAPFATRAEDGSVVLHDARFYDPRARDRFSVALPDVECVPLDQELTAE